MVSTGLGDIQKAFSPANSFSNAGSFDKGEEQVLSAAAEQKLNLAVSLAAHRETFLYLSGMIVGQLVCIVMYIITKASGGHSMVPIFAISFTLGFHIICALLIAFDLRWQGSSRTLRRMIVWCTILTFQVDTFILAESRADVQHYAHYNMELPSFLMTFSDHCEEMGDHFEEAAEDICLIQSSQTTHGLSLFWVIYFVLFIMQRRHLLPSALVSTVIYTGMAMLGAFELHHDMYEDHAQLYLQSDFFWWVLSLGAAAAARVRLDKGRDALMFQHEYQVQQTIKEKVLRCEAEFKNERFEDMVVVDINTTIMEDSVYEGDVDAGVQQLLAGKGPKQPGLTTSSMPDMPVRTGPKLTERSEAEVSLISSACLGDCLPADSLLWVDGFSTVRRLDSITEGQRILCYDSYACCLKYTSVLSIGKTAACNSKDTEWVTVSLEDGTDLQMTADHPVQCTSNEVHGSSAQSSGLRCQGARDLQAGCDEVMVMKLASVPVKSVSLLGGRSNGYWANGQANGKDAWKISVQQPDRHMIFVSKGGAANGYQQQKFSVSAMTVGASNLVPAFDPRLSDLHSTVSAPAYYLPNLGSQQLNTNIIKESAIWEANSDVNGDGMSETTAQESNALAGSAAGDRRRCEYWVATHLASLEGTDPRRVLKLKNIALLGFGSAKVLREYLSQFGVVEAVLLCRSQEETPQRVDGHRHRPSMFCFVVMETVEAAAAVLRRGPSQNVAGVTVQLQKFVARAQKDDSSTTAKPTPKGIQNTSSNMSQQSATVSNGYGAHETDIPAEPNVQKPIPGCRFWPAVVQRLEV
jgi:hypothetical protein